MVDGETDIEQLLNMERRIRDQKDLNSNISFFLSNKRWVDIIKKRIFGQLASLVLNWVF